MACTLTVWTVIRMHEILKALSFSHLPLDYVEKWYDPAHDGHELECWLDGHVKFPWAKSVDLINTARALAETPEERDDLMHPALHAMLHAKEWPVIKVWTCGDFPPSIRAIYAAQELIDIAFEGMDEDIAVCQRDDYTIMLTKQAGENFVSINVTKDSPVEAFFGFADPMKNRTVRVPRYPADPDPIREMILEHFKGPL